ncbi:MAG: SDR family oxidoreductase [bacterium]
MDISGKVALITGGASGLGEASARLFHASGCKVAIFDMNEERGQAVAAELGADAKYYHVDVTSEDGVADAIAGIEETFGPIHICCNFAGIVAGEKMYGKKGPMGLEIFRKIIEVNLVGTVNVTRLAVASMAKVDPVTEDGQRGVVINTSSIAAYEGQVGQTAYSASKGAIVGMTLPIARDLAGMGIRCNAIAPGLIHTPMFDSLPEDVYESLSQQPLNPRRLGHPSEIAQTAKFIVENDYVNGQVIRVDGGIRMQPR